MKVLVDTNIILDIFLEREFYLKESLAVMLICEKYEVIGFVSASAITDIYYIARKTLQDKEKLINMLRKLFQVLKIAPVNEANIEEALSLGWNDFEDALQFSIGKSINAKYIITRDIKGFAEADNTIRVLTPSSFLRDWLTP
jgi:predicted nucleic acid-binding protein